MGWRPGRAVREDAGDVRDRVSGAVALSLTDGPMHPPGIASGVLQPFSDDAAGLTLSLSKSDEGLHAVRPELV